MFLIVGVIVIMSRGRRRRYNNRYLYKISVLGVERWNNLLRLYSLLVFCFLLLFVIILFVWFILWILVVIYREGFRYNYES